MSAICMIQWALCLYFYIITNIIIQCFFLKIFDGTKKIFAGTNTREISELTLFLVIYTQI